MKKNKDLIKWIQIADEDFDSAKILNEALRKYSKIICCHCAQAKEFCLLDRKEIF